MTTPAEEAQLARAELHRHLRDYMRDRVQFNTLLDDEESDDVMFDDAISYVWETLLSMPPPIGLIPLANIPRNLMLDGCAAYLLRSAAILYMRNDLDFSSGTVSVAFRQPMAYMQTEKRHQDMFDAAAIKWKVAINLQQAVRAVCGLSSDWTLVTASAPRYAWGMLGQR